MGTNVQTGHGPAPVRRRGLPVGRLFLALGCLSLLGIAPALAQSPAAQGAADDKPVEIAGPGNKLDPLGIYYGNTIVCGRTHSSNDLCHVWFYPKGKMVIFDQGGLHPAHYKVFSYRKSGAISICMYWDDDHVVQPADLVEQAQPLPLRGPMPKLPGKDPGRYCMNDASGRTTCRNTKDVSKLAPAAQAAAHETMGQRWHDGMCYPYREDVKPGAIWQEYDDPAPSEDGGDKVWFLAGHH